MRAYQILTDQHSVNNGISQKATPSFYANMFPTSGSIGFGINASPPVSGNWKIGVCRKVRLGPSPLNWCYVDSPGEAIMFSPNFTNTVVVGAGATNAVVYDVCLEVTTVSPVAGSFPRINAWIVT